MLSAAAASLAGGVIVEGHAGILEPLVRALVAVKGTDQMRMRRASWCAVDGEAAAAGRRVEAPGVPRLGLAVGEELVGGGFAADALLVPVEEAASFGVVEDGLGVFAEVVAAVSQPSVVEFAGQHAHGVE